MCTGITQCLCAFAGKSNETERQGSRCDAENERDADNNERDDNGDDENDERDAENNEHKDNNCSATKPWFLYILLWYHANINNCILHIVLNH